MIIPDTLIITCLLDQSCNKSTDVLLLHKYSLKQFYKLIFRRPFMKHIWGILIDQCVFSLDHVKHGLQQFLPFCSVLIGASVPSMGGHKPLQVKAATMQYSNVTTLTFLHSHMTVNDPINCYETTNSSCFLHLYQFCGLS